MKKLILIASLLFSLNGWAQDENPFDAWFEDAEIKYPRLEQVGNYDGVIVCFSDGTKTHDIDNLYILREDLEGIERSLDYETQDLFGNKKSGYLMWNGRSSTSCNITWNTYEEVCIKKDGSETDMKNCEE